MLDSEKWESSVEKNITDEYQVMIPTYVLAGSPVIEGSLLNTDTFILDAIILFISFFQTTN